MTEQTKLTPTEAVEKQAMSAVLNKVKMGKTFRDHANTLSQKTLAEIFHITRKILHEWEVDGMPRNSDKTYDLYAVGEWLGKGGASQSEDIKGQIAAEELRIKKARREKAELDLETAASRKRNLF
uniref:Uncharacterized protein n=1 Tax=viral metagenome TaxID=1070528 RepID=A0A6M3IW28_9ZZZZ